MIRNLMEVGHVNVDAENKAKVEIQRGQFVTVDVTKNEVTKATDLGGATGIAVRDIVVTDDVANGFPVSEYDLSQDVIKVGEFLGVRTLHNGEQWATDQYKAEVAKGLYLDVENGVLKASTGNAKTSLVSLGMIDDAGHKVLAYKVTL